MKWNKWLAGALLLSLLLTGCQTGGQKNPSSSSTASAPQTETQRPDTPSKSPSELGGFSSVLTPGQGAAGSTPAAPVNPNDISFPYAIPGTQLVIRDIRPYNGLFLEDGSDQTVSNISVMILENRGVGLEYAAITLVQGDRQLTFKATAIPGGTQAVVQEASAAEYRKGGYTQCGVEIALLDHFEKSESYIRVEENESGSLVVSNLTDEVIPCVRVFYKFVLEAGEIYVGGITYTAKILDLKPGEPQTVAPSHYAAGYSEIMMVRAYETAQ